MTQVGHLNDLHETFDGKGLTVLSVSGQDLETVGAFADKYGATYPIAAKAQSGAYSTGGVPSAYLIGADGTVVWQGHPGNLQDDDIEGYLKDVAKSDRVSTWAFALSRQLPEVPAALDGVQKLLVKMKFGAALKKVESTLARMEGDDKEAGEALREWIAASGETGMEKAAAFVRDGQVYKGYQTYEEIEDRYKGHALSKSAKDAAKALEKDKATGLEIKASEKLDEIKKEMRGERNPEKQLDCLKALLGKKYAETLAGKQAAEMAGKLEAKIGK